MNEPTPPRRVPQEDLWLRADDLFESQRLVAIAALGMCNALTQNAVTPAYACHQLFGPALLSRLASMNAHPELRHALHLASEFEDVADVAPDKLASAIAEVQDKLLGVLLALAPPEPAGEKWLVPLPEQRA
ncbi:hypothetical protein MYSTI_03562 [Myxococcus stipitatus DSM 14675]|uniref:Uncharacterized protein n=1 Tax=Myxococcus stipitatus (strain DSM 14675 / JCM 12634 / Mx s8) TaxID=1278073 RepID=L7UA00_MYXSD|nr:DUF3969 family protein [Myxococcus stipitatus]AGC44868.1 hypothetical protein MYSTI_03562 [Myxococcus stipitatus DSM 14675]